MSHKLLYIPKKKQKYSERFYMGIPHNFSPCDRKKMFVCHYFWDKQYMECIIELVVCRFPSSIHSSIKNLVFHQQSIYIPKNGFLATYICIHVILSGYTFSRLLNVVIIYLLLFKQQRICQQVREFQSYISVSMQCATMKSYTQTTKLDT